MLQIRVVAISLVCAGACTPTLSQPRGDAHLEAMAHGRPCVGSVHDAAGDVIEDGVTGRLVDQADIQGLSTTLAALLVDEPLRRRMGEAGRARLRARFSFDRFRARVLHLLGATVPSPAMSVSA